MSGIPRRLSVSLGFESNVRNRKQRARAAIKMCIHRSRWERIIRCPMRQRLAIDQQLILSVTCAQIEIPHTNGISTSRPPRFRAQRAPTRPIANHRLPAGSRLPGRDINSCVSIRLHGLRFNTIRVVPHPPQLIGNAGNILEPRRHRIPPHHRMASLVLKQRQRFVITLVIDQATKHLPSRQVRSGQSQRPHSASRRHTAPTSFRYAARGRKARDA